MFRSYDHLQGATLFLAKVAFLNSQSQVPQYKDTHSQAHCQWRTTYTICHAATTLI